MSQVGVYRDAHVLINGSDLRAELHTLALDYAAELLDATVFGSDTRIMQGGLKTAKVEAVGFFQSGDGALEQVAFSLAGVDDTVFVLFPDGVTEGAVSSGMGYALRGTVGDMKFGRGVGKLVEVSLSAQGRNPY